MVSGRGMVSRETIVLASNSASRKAMLSAAAVEFDAIAADVDERALEAEMDNAEPPEIAQALAAAKAAAVSALHPDRLVLGSDSTSRQAASRPKIICASFPAER